MNDNSKNNNEEGVLGYYTTQLSPYITITRPILTDEEKAKRMNEIKRTAVALVIATDRAKVKRTKEELRA